MTPVPGHDAADPALSQRQPVAVSDLHGRLDLLAELLARFPGRCFIFLGDYVDRGPDSAGVIAQVRALVAAGRATALLGNHDEMMVLAAAAPAGWAAREWLTHYGQVTLDSYGDWATLQVDAAWLATLPRVHVEAGVLYAHALRPHPSGLDADPETPLWGRPNDTVMYPLPPGVTVSVHGHTIVPHPQRVTCEDGSHAWFIDTGAFHTGTLCALDTATWTPSLIQRPAHAEALAELDEHGPDAPGALERAEGLATSGRDGA
ncbi:metallophosphoesterase family protein [uncultured Deinococcus sp.]|uniref:metallophosphoesterase family protein n=1 Tax=uncultured Deinococcus sp. TaxID=158789 RepID=UPI0025E9F806|nr:metallophosphoesterase family protein [uncultured Deinococcus sp.]